MEGKVTNELMEGILKARKTLRNPIHLTFSQDKLYMAIPFEAQSLFEHPVSKRVSKRSMKQEYKALADFLSCIVLMDVHTRQYEQKSTTS